MDVTIDSRFDKCSIDLGLHFALSHVRQLLLLSIAPILVQLFAVSLQFRESISAQQMFLAEIINLLADTWLVAAAVMLSISAVKAESFSTKALLTRALQYLPKIFLSYLALAIVVLSIIYMPPLLLFAVFFIWAPYFCVAETFEKKPKKSEEEYSEYQEESQAPSSSQVRWLERKSILDLGFARSVHLVGSNIAITLQIVLFMWFSSVVPRACVNLFTPVHEGVFALSLKVVLLGVITAFVSAVVGVVFIACLPSKARDEISIPSDWEWKLLSEKNVTFRFQGRPVIIAVLMILSGLATYFLYNDLRASLSPPSTISTSIESVSWNEDRLKVQVRIEDRDASFRWLTDVNGWQLALQATLSTTATQITNIVPQLANNSSNVVDRMVDQSSTLPVIKVAQVMMKNLSGDEENLPQSTSLKENATLVFYFELPDTAVQSFVTLEHVSHYGDRTSLGRFMVPDKLK